MLPCHVVKDLLPSYLEHLTSPETDAAVEAHLAACEACQSARAAMEAELSLEAPPAPKLNFLRKLKRRQIAGALLSFLLMLSCMLWLYGLEYHVDLADTAAVKTLILNSISYDSRYADTEIQLLESLRVKNRVLLLYRLEDQDGYRGKGVACFERGLLGKYRAHSIGATTWALDSYAPLRIGRQDYLLVANVNPPVGASSLQIYADYHMPWYEGDPISELLTTTQPVYEGPAEAQHFFLVPLTEEQAEKVYWEFSGVYRDESGKLLDSTEIARQHYGMETSISGGVLGHGHFPQALCFWLVLTLLLGLIFIRYFLVF